MPLPKRMKWSSRFHFAWRILTGQLNAVNTVQTPLLYEVTLRNRNKTWYKKRDEGKFPFLEPEDDQ